MFKEILSPRQELYSCKDKNSCPDISFLIQLLVITTFHVQLVSDSQCYNIRKRKIVFEFNHLLIIHENNRLLKYAVFVRTDTIDNDS